MRKPEKVITHEQMMEKLARRIKPQVSINPPEAAQTPKAELRVPLEWLTPVKTGERSAYIATACGMFTVSKDVSGEGITYTAWRATKPATNLGCVKLADEAKALCEAAR